MSELDLNDLCQEIGKLCQDFNSEWAAESEIQALSFMQKVLFEISPQSHSIKKKKGDDTRWKMTMVDGGIIHIATFFNRPPPAGQPRIHNGNELLLTVDQAVLLATVCMEKLAPIALERNCNFLPPLTAAVFNMSNIVEIAKELNLSTEKVTQTVISSAVKSGFLLTHSSAAVAVVYAFYAIEDATKREHAKAKIIESYSSKGKHYNEQEFAVYRNHCLGIQSKEFVSFAIRTLDQIHKRP